MKRDQQTRPEPTAVRDWGYTRIASIEGSRPDPAEAGNTWVSLYHCPRCDGLVHGDEYSTALLGHIDWHMKITQG